LIGALPGCTSSAAWSTAGSEQSLPRAWARTRQKALNWILAVIVAVTAIYMLYKHLAAFHL